MCKLCFTQTLRELIALSTFSPTAKLQEIETSRQAAPRGTACTAEGTVSSTQNSAWKMIQKTKDTAKKKACSQSQKTLVIGCSFPTDLPRSQCLWGDLHGRWNRFIPKGCTIINITREPHSKYIPLITLQVVSSFHTKHVTSLILKISFRKRSMSQLSWILKEKRKFRSTTLSSFRQHWKQRTRLEERTRLQSNCCRSMHPSVQIPQLFH